MARRPSMYKEEKRKKEVKRKKKQEEKRLKRRTDVRATSQEFNSSEDVPESTD